MLSLFLQNHLFSLTILASDKGSPSQSTSVLVYLNVKDVNDNEPQFNHQSYAGQVLENTAVGTVVLTVQATDIDSGEPQRPSLICITHTTMIALRFQRSPMSLIKSFRWRDGSSVQKHAPFGKWHLVWIPCRLSVQYKGLEAKLMKSTGIFGIWNIFVLK